MTKGSLFKFGSNICMMNICDDNIRREFKVGKHNEEIDRAFLITMSKEIKKH